MLYVHTLSDGGRPNMPALVVHEVNDPVVIARWADREQVPILDETAAVADVTTWIYPGGHITQRFAEGPRWRDLAP